MKQFKAQAIVLRRVNYGEADRIITFLTLTHGKVGAMAKGVRRSQSKLAGGLEPFSESTITFGQGKGDLHIVLSTRLEKFYGTILADYDRLQLGYEAIKLIDRSTEDNVGSEFYDLLKKTFAYLDAPVINPGFTEVWFRVQLETLLGRMPSLSTDANGNKLQADKKYAFDARESGLLESQFGTLCAEHIKLLRLAQSHSPAVLAHVEGVEGLLLECLIFARAVTTG